MKIYLLLNSVITDVLHSICPPSRLNEPHDVHARPLGTGAAHGGARSPGAPPVPPVRCADPGGGGLVHSAVGRDLRGPGRVGEAQTADRMGEIESS